VCRRRLALGVANLEVLDRVLKATQLRRRPSRAPILESRNWRISSGSVPTWRQACRTASAGTPITSPHNARSSGSAGSTRVFRSSQLSACKGWSWAMTDRTAFFAIPCRMSSQGRMLALSAVFTFVKKTANSLPGPAGWRLHNLLVCANLKMRDLPTRRNVTWPRPTSTISRF
jgi:hypothetical protein